MCTTLPHDHQSFIMILFSNWWNHSQRRRVYRRSVSKCYSILWYDDEFNLAIIIIISVYYYISSFIEIINNTTLLLLFFL